MVQQPIALVRIHHPLSNIVPALQRPQRPVRIVALHVAHQTLQVRLLERELRVAEQVAARAGDDLRRAKLGQPQGRGEGPILLEHEARPGAQDVVVDGAHGGGDGEGPVVGVELEHGLVRPGAGVERRGLQVAQVRGGGDAAEDDQQVRVAGVDGLRPLRHQAVPVRVVVRVLGSDGAQLVAQRHADDVGVRGGEGGHGGEAGEPVGCVEPLRVGGGVARGRVPPAVAVGAVAAPLGFGDVVVEDDAYGVGGEGGDDGLEGGEAGGGAEERVLRDGVGVLGLQRSEVGIGAAGVGGLGEGVGDADVGS